MSTTELIVNSVIIAFVIGLIVGIAVWDAVVAQPWRLKAETYRARLAKAQVRAATTGHAGTPYRPETVQAARATDTPGLRVVEGHRLYSADWL